MLCVIRDAAVHVRARAHITHIRSGVEFNSTTLLGVYYWFAVNPDPQVPKQVNGPA